VRPSELQTSALPAPPPPPLPPPPVLRLPCWELGLLGACSSATDAVDFLFFLEPMDGAAGSPKREWDADMPAARTAGVSGVRTVRCDECKHRRKCASNACNAHRQQRLMRRWKARKPLPGQASLSA